MKYILKKIKEVRLEQGDAKDEGGETKWQQIEN